MLLLSHYCARWHRYFLSFVGFCQKTMLSAYYEVLLLLHVFDCFFHLCIQIPQCAERDVALTQLDRDSGKDSQHVTALTFQFRESTDGKSGNKTEFGVSPFFTPCGPLKALGSESAKLDFSIRAPTTSKNLYRVLRALQVSLGKHPRCLGHFIYSAKSRDWRCSRWRLLSVVFEIG